MVTGCSKNINDYILHLYLITFTKYRRMKCLSFLSKTSVFVPRSSTKESRQMLSNYESTAEHYH